SGLRRPRRKHRAVRESSGAPDPRIAAGPGGRDSVSMLTDRLRGIVGPPSPAATAGPAQRSPAAMGEQAQRSAEAMEEQAQRSPAAYDSLERILGGRRSDDGRLCVVERRVDATASHGRMSIGDLAAEVGRGACEAPLLTA